MSEPKRLTRDVSKGMLGGVCAGFAEYLDVDVTLVRVLYVILTIFTAFSGVLVYVILWVLVPAKVPAIPPPTAVAQQR